MLACQEGVISKERQREREKKERTKEKLTNLSSSVVVAIENNKNFCQNCPLEFFLKKLCRKQEQFFRAINTQTISGCGLACTIKPLCKQLPMGKFTVYLGPTIRWHLNNQCYKFALELVRQMGSVTRWLCHLGTQKKTQKSPNIF